MDKSWEYRNDENRIKPWMSGPMVRLVDSWNPWKRNEEKSKKTVPRTGTGAPRWEA